MMNDSVREELKDKISPITKIPEPVIRRTATPPAPIPFMPARSAMLARAVEVAPSPEPTPELEPIRVETAEIAAKQTSPTLVEFQNKNATVPDWKLELQNAVRKRREAASELASSAVAVSAGSGSNGAGVARAEVTAFAAAETAPADNKLEGALKRIEESRRRYLGEAAVATARAEAPAPARPAVQPQPAPAVKAYPFYIATKNAAVLPRPVDVKPPATLAPRPVIEELPIIEKKDLDTSKLKPLPNASIIAENLDKTQAADSEDIHDTTEAPLITISRALDGDFDDEEMFGASLEDEEIEEIDDLAPLGMRFNAALLDLIIGTFASIVLLSPLMISGGRWLSPAGALAFAVMLAIVMFIYLTTAIGFFGQTLGMKIFSLEVVDVEEEAYPTLHQAAVNSSVYIASLAFAGLGFIPVLFNDERRAAHDLISGTIVVREEC